MLPDFSEIISRLCHIRRRRRGVVDHCPFPQRGEVEIIVYEGAPGGPVREVIRPNLVVDLARQMLSRLVGGASGSPSINSGLHGVVSITALSELLPSRMKWGNGGHDPSSPATAIPPAASDEDIYAPINVLAAPLTTYKSVTVDYPSDTSVRFTATLLNAEGNTPGTLSEEGLFSYTGAVELLWARSTYGLISKSAAISLEFRHTFVW